MPKKTVIYNGRTDSSYVGANPKLLVVGQQYEVTSETKKDYQTDYTLAGLEGSFNSNWFSEVITFFPSTYLAVSNTIPCNGEPYNCSKIKFEDGKWRMKKCETSTVQSVFKIGENTYQVITNDCIYIIDVH